MDKGIRGRCLILQPWTFSKKEKEKENIIMDKLIENEATKANWFALLLAITSDKPISSKEACLYMGIPVDISEE